MATYKINMCSHLGQLVNQGYWWCGLKDENGRQKHPHCDCVNCPDKDETYVVSETYTAGEEK